MSRPGVDMTVRAAAWLSVRLLALAVYVGGALIATMWGV